MILRFTKVNIHILPPEGGLDRLALDRAILVIDTEATTIKAYDRESETLQMTLLTGMISSYTKAKIKSPNGSMRKGKTVLKVEDGVFVGSQVTKKITLKMSVEDHDTLHSLVSPS